MSDEANGYPVEDAMTGDEILHEGGRQVAEPASDEVNDESVDEKSPSVVPGPPDSFYDFIRERREQDESYAEAIKDPQYAQFTREAFEEYSSKHDFAIGDLVQWKRFMKNKRFPAPVAPAIVVSKIETIVTHNDEGEALEPEDIMLGFLNGDLTFQVFPFNSARFMPWSD